MTLPGSWTRRPESERRMVAAIATVVAVILFATFAWIPLERSRARLEREVPELRAAVAALRKDADEVARLRALPPIAAASATPVAGLAAGALAPPAGARLAPVDARRLKLDAADIGFTPLVHWLASAPAAQGLRVESARIEALATSGRVRAEITLARP
jgi:general secretion pathway protein M